MANAIRMTSAYFSDTGIQRTLDQKDKVFNLGTIKAFNEDQFYECLEPNVLDNFIQFCTALGLSDSDEVLSTYTTQNGEFFSIPYVQLDEEDFLVLVFGEQVIRMEYEPRTKSYQVNGLHFKPMAWIDGETKKITAAYFSMKMEVEVDGLSAEVEYSVSAKAKKDIDLKALVVKLQKGEIPSVYELGKIGVGGGFTKALKPWMLNKGFWQLMTVNDPVTVSNDKGSFVVQTGDICQIDPNTGEQIPDTNVIVSLKAVPFKPMHISQCTGGFNYLFLIDGGYKNADGNASTLGTGRIVGLKRGEAPTKKELIEFVGEARKEMIVKRKGINSTAIFSPQYIEDAVAAYLAPKEKAETTPANYSVSTDTLKEKVASAPDFDDIPF